MLRSPSKNPSVAVSTNGKSPAKSRAELTRPEGVPGFGHVCEKDGAREGGGAVQCWLLPSSCSLPPSNSFFFSHLHCARCQLGIGRREMVRADGQRMGWKERMNGEDREREERLWGSVIHANCVYCLRRLLPSSSLSFSFISFHRDSGPNSIKEEEGESLAVMIGSERDGGRAMPCPIFRDKRAQLFPSICARATRAENN